MTRISEGPHGWVEDFLRKAASAGLSAEHLKMLNSDPHLLRQWIAFLPSIEQSVAPVVQVAVNATTRISLSEALPEGGTAIVTLTKRMGVNWLDDLATLCATELCSLRAFGPKRLARIEEVLAEHDMKLDDHPVTQCRYYPSKHDWPLRRAQAEMESVSELTDLYHCLTERGKETVSLFGHSVDKRVLTLGEFRNMSDSARLELITPTGINKILAVVDRYQL